MKVNLNELTSPLCAERRGAPKSRPSSRRRRGLSPKAVHDSPVP